MSAALETCFNPALARGRGGTADELGEAGMDYDVWIAQDNIRRYREMLERERNVLARAKLEGLIMAEEDKVAYLARDFSEMEDRATDGPK
jgi:hypothetical protein